MPEQSTDFGPIKPGDLTTIAVPSVFPNKGTVQWEKKHGFGFRRPTSTCSTNGTGVAVLQNSAKCTQYTDLTVEGEYTLEHVIRGNQSLIRLTGEKNGQTCDFATFDGKTRDPANVIITGENDPETSEYQLSVGDTLKMDIAPGRYTKMDRKGGFHYVATDRGTLESVRP